MWFLHSRIKCSNEHFRSVLIFKWFWIYVKINIILFLGLRCSKWLRYHFDSPCITTCNVEIMWGMPLPVTFDFSNLMYCEENREISINEVKHFAITLFLLLKRKCVFKLPKARITTLMYYFCNCYFGREETKECDKKWVHAEFTAFVPDNPFMQGKWRLPSFTSAAARDLKKTTSTALKIKKSTLSSSIWIPSECKHASLA